MKKVVTLIAITAAVLVLALAYFRFLAPATGFSGKTKYLHIPTFAAQRGAVLDSIAADSILKTGTHFDWLAQKLGYWENIKPGRYKIADGMSVREVLFLLRSGKQTPTRLVINKLRLPADLARLMANATQNDSAAIMAFLGNNDSLALLQLDTTQLMARIMPDTYELFWTWEPPKVLEKLAEHRSRWWKKNDREAKAAALGLSPDEVHTLASIVDEETNKKDEKGLVASVYLNRLQKGMPLQADPTIRFALRNFTMNRVYYKQLRTPSPYNTYLNRGLPPGPICTPSGNTIDAVLNAPETDYLFFVANADLRGGHTFTSNLADHGRAARLYQDSLTAWLKRKQQRENQQ